MKHTNRDTFIQMDACIKGYIHRGIHTHTEGYNYSTLIIIEKSGLISVL